MVWRKVEAKAVTISQQRRMAEESISCIYEFSVLCNPTAGSSQDLSLKHDRKMQGASWENW